MAAGTLARLRYIVDIDDHATGKLRRLDAVTGDLGDGLDSTVAQLHILKGALMAVGSVAAITAGSVALIAWQGAKVSTELATVEATTKATGEQMNALRREIAYIGQVTPASVTQVAEAFKQLSFAGFEVNQIMKSGMDVVELATAAHMNMADAAKLVAQNLRAFNLNAEDAAAVSNTLSAVFAESNTTIEELGNALSYVNATANQLGFSLTNTTALLGVMANAGIAGTRAGTSLNQAFSKLFSQTGEVNKALNAVGLSIQSFVDDSGEVKDAITIFEILKERMDALGMTDAGRVAFLNDLFGRRGARAAQPIINDLEQAKELAQDASFAQFRSELESTRKLAAEDWPDVRTKLFGEGAAKDDALENMPKPGALLARLRDEYGTGEQAAAQIKGALMQAFAIEDEAAERVANLLADQRVTIEEYAEAMGVTTKRAREMAQGLSSTEMAIEMVQNRMNSATTDADIYGKFMQTVGGQVEYLTGTLSAIAQEMFIGMAPALSTFLEGLKDLGDALAAQDELLRAMGKALFYVAAALVPVTLGLAAVYGYASLLLALKVNSFMWALATSGGALGGVFNTLAGAAGLLTMNASGLAGVVSGALYSGFTTLLGVIPWVMTTVSSLATGLSMTAAAASSASGIMGTLGAVAGGLTGTLTGLTGGLFGVLGLLGPLGWAVAAVVAVFALWLTDFKNFRTKVKPFTDALAGALDGVLDFAGAVGGWAMWALRGLYETLDDTGAITGFVDAIAFILRGVGGLITVITRLLHVMGRGANIIGEFFWNLHPDRWNRFKDTLEEIVRLIEYIPGINFPDKNPPNAKSTEQRVQEQADAVTGGDAKVYDNPEDRGKQAGAGVMMGMAAGIKQHNKKPAEETKKAATRTAAYLPSSNARRGPLSNLTERGRKTLTTYAKGMRRARGTATAAAQGSMAAIARQLGPDGLADKGRRTFRKLAKSVERTHDPLDTALTKFETANDRVEDLFALLRGLRNFQLNLGRILNPLATLREWFSKNILGGRDLIGWLSGLGSFNLKMPNLLNGLRTLHDKLKDIIKDTKKAIDELVRLDQNQPGGDDESDGGDESGKPGETSKDDHDKREGDQGAPLTKKNTGGDMTTAGYSSSPITKRGTKAREKYGRRIARDEIEKFRAGLSTEAIKQIRSRHGVNGKIPWSVWRQEIRRRLDTGEQAGHGKEAQRRGRGRGMGVGGLGAGQSGRFASLGFPDALRPQAGTKRAQRQQSRRQRALGPLRGALTRLRRLTGLGQPRDAGQPRAGGGGPDMRVAPPNPADRALTSMRKQRLATQRALSRAQPLMPKAYNAVRSDLIPSFVPTYSDPGTQTPTQNQNQNQDGTQNPNQNQDGQQQNGQNGQNQDGTPNQNQPGGGPNTGPSTASAPAVGTLNYSPSVSVSGGDAQTNREELAAELDNHSQRMVESLAQALTRDASETTDDSGTVI